MEYVLPAVLVLGVLLFVISWLIVIAAGFKNHPVTGIVALIPGLNLLILPSIWYRVDAWVITGFVGLLLTVGAWFLGGADQLSQHTQKLGAQVGLPMPAPTPAAPPATPAPSNVPAAATVEIPKAARNGNAPAPAAVAEQAITQPLELPKAPAANSANSADGATTTETAAQAAPEVTTPAAPLPAMEDLPTNALYKLVFEDISVDKLDATKGKQVRVILKDGKKHEGRVQSASDDEITIEEHMESGTVTLPIKLATIRQAAVMVRKQGK